MISSLDKSSYRPEERAGEDVNCVVSGQNSLIPEDDPFSNGSVLSFVATTINAMSRERDSRASKRVVKQPGFSKRVSFCRLVSPLWMATSGVSFCRLAGSPLSISSCLKTLPVQ